MSDTGGPEGQTLLFLTDEQLRKGIEAMFFAYRGFTADPDRRIGQVDTFTGSSHWATSKQNCLLRNGPDRSGETLQTSGCNWSVLCMEATWRRPRS